MPLVKVDEDAGELVLSWPPEGRPASVSIEAESLALHGPLELEQTGDAYFGVSPAKSDFRTAYVVLRWPEPLRELLGLSTGPDSLQALKHMRELAEESNVNPDVAIRRARRLSAEYVTEGEAMLGQAWFWPTYVAGGLYDEQAALTDLEGRYDLSFRTLADAQRSPEFQELMSSIIPIRSAWGHIGLFWCLLLDQLESQVTFVRCDRCGSLIPRRRNTKRFCAQNDNSDCYRSRRNADERRSRVQRLNGA
jgi:hypothetical protein